MYKNNKKIISEIMIFIFVLFIGVRSVMADCDAAIFGNPNVEGNLGYYIKTALNLLRWIAPLIVILYGTFDMVKAVVASSEDKMKQAQNMLLKRIIIAISLFFVPSLVSALLDLFASSGGDVTKCYFNW